MEPARKAQLVYLAVIALLVALAGALWYAYQQESRETERIAAAMREVHRSREGLQASYLNQPVQVEALRSKLQQLAGRAGFPQLLLRFGAPADEAAATPRRRLDEVLEEA